MLREMLKTQSNPESSGKKIFIFVIIFMIFKFINLMAMQSEMTIIDLTNSKEIVVTEEVSSEIIDEHIKITNTGSRTELIWEATDAWAICKSVGISDETYCPFIGWHSNDEDWAYFGETTNIPIWEYNINGAEYLPHDITSDGTYMVGGTGNTIFGFVASSNIPDWSYSINNPDDEIFQIVVSNDCTTVYFVSGDDYDYSFITSVDINTSTENWSYLLPLGGYCASLVLSNNNEKILITQYYDAIIYSNVGELIFQTSIGNGSQCTPAISNDGSLFVIGDLHGYVNVYEYNENTSTYEEKWEYLFMWGTYYDWVEALAISEDGSIIAAGSFDFGDGSTESYCGELAIFNADSNNPLWIYECGDDKIANIDMNIDGSIIAACSWGPLYDNDDDFWFFNIDSNEPVFSYNCQGSPIDIDLSNDGSRCIVGGKAVHCRTIGHGGKLYYFDNSPEYGAISGVVTDADTGNPLEDALITVGTYTATSNFFGEYFIEQIEMGDYTLTCELIGYELYSEDIVVDNIEIIDIALQVEIGLEDLTNLNEKIFLTNYPNPFNHSTTISFNISRKDAKNAKIEIFNIKGQKIRQYSIFNSQSSIVWNGTDENNQSSSSGIYFYKLCLYPDLSGKVGDYYSETKRMMLLK